MAGLSGKFFAQAAFIVWVEFLWGFMNVPLAWPCAVLSKKNPLVASVKSLLGT
ncbi:MAG: hypothetical protein ABJP79_09245 [Tateyamaria sp.]|uniref:hypothetical protein n=1 Tax=Tateyamaria sp. TaxID=1929288 RepID=UPI00329F4D15